MRRKTQTSHRTLTLWLLASLVLATAALGRGTTPTKPIPYNVAEAIVDPFWSPSISTLDLWTLEDTGNGATIEQNWCWADYQWLRHPAEGPAFRMTRTTPIACSGYDRLVVSITAPPGARVKVLAETDRGSVRHAAPPATDQKAEIEVDLNGATVVRELTLEVHAQPTGAMSGWINWVGLRDTARLEVYRDRWKRQQDVDWTRHLKPRSYRPRFEPAYGIAVSAQEIEELRREHRSQLQETDNSVYVDRAAALKKLTPERFISEFAMGGGDHRYNDVRDHGHPQYRGSEALMAAMVLRDEELLRLAARYALSLAMCQHWVEGFVCQFPGSDFEHRAFLKNSRCHAIALALDLAGDVFTEAGTRFLQRRLAEEGLGTINYVMWRYEYIHHCNQVAYFSPGRMYAYLILEDDWPRTKPYTELALADVVNNLKNAIESDGGCLEGPSYLAPTIRENFRAISYYARSRGKDVFEIVPDNLKNMGNFAAVIASTTAGNDVIPICDASSGMSIGTALILSSILPDSFWVTMAHKAIDRNGPPTDSFNRRLLKALPSRTECPDLPAFVHLPVTGHMASMRRLHDQYVKILIVGNRKNAGHAHEDKGSFVLEFAGDTFALDPGTCSYSSPLSNEYGTCQRHNMLVPFGADITERPHPPHTLPFDVYPTGRGDENSFEAHVDATPGWDEYYEKWTRSWTSPAPDTLRIYDAYSLKKGEGVEFYWQTRLPVAIDGTEVTLTGRAGLVTLTIPENCTVRLDKLPLYKGGTQTRIAICKPGRAGQMTVTARLALKIGGGHGSTIQRHERHR